MEEDWEAINCLEKIGHENKYVIDCLLGIFQEQIELSQISNLLNTISLFMYCTQHIVYPNFYRAYKSEIP
jgi:hypothetical protein